MTSQLMHPPVDEFAGEDYGPTLSSLPYLQVINDQDPDKAGFFISASNADAVHFNAPAEWEPFEAQFQSGTEVGFRSLTSRMVILRRSPLLMFSRETKEFLGSFNRSCYDAAAVLLKTRYGLFIVTVAVGEYLKGLSGRG